MEMDRRTLLHGAAAVGGLLLASRVPAHAGGARRAPGWIEGKMTGAMAVVETLVQEGCDCVYGIPGAQENELWDAMKSRGLPYLLCTHEFSDSAMADLYARYQRGDFDIVAISDDVDRAKMLGFVRQYRPPFTVTFGRTRQLSCT